MTVLSTTKYRRQKIQVVLDGDRLSVEVRNTRNILVGALPVRTLEEGICEGQGLVDLRLGTAS